MKKNVAKIKIASFKNKQTKNWVKIEINKK